MKTYYKFIKVHKLTCFGLIRRQVCDLEPWRKNACRHHSFIRLQGSSGSFFLFFSAHSLFSSSGSSFPWLGLTTDFLIQIIHCSVEALCGRKYLGLNKEFQATISGTQPKEAIYMLFNKIKGLIKANLSLLLLITG